MINPAFFVASMVGFHVEFSQSMYSSKCPYSTAISCTRVTGPSVYWRSSLAPALTSWARASSESEAARHMNTIIVLGIFCSPRCDISLITGAVTQYGRNLFGNAYRTWPIPLISAGQEPANLPHRVIDLHVECALPQLRR